MPSIQAIWWVPNRLARNRAIFRTMAARIRGRVRKGRVERSRSPASPSSRNRCTHFDAVCRLTQAATAASVMLQPSSVTRFAIARRE